MGQAYFVGIDLGGTTIGAVLANEAGDVLKQESIATESHAGPDTVIARMIDLTEQLSRHAGVSVSGVGIGCPGLVDLRRGVTRFLPNLPTQWRNVPVADMVGEQLKCPVHLINDVRAATLGERTYGLGRDVQTMAFFSLGTGVGGGLVIDGRLRLGPLGAAGELGHQTIEPDGPLCGCGNRGCLETLASGPAITAEGVRLMLSGQAPQLFAMVSGDVSKMTPRVMAEAARAGDTGAQSAIDRAAGYLGIGVANIVSAIHPELVVLGGGVAELEDLLLEPVRRIVRERVRMFSPADVRIERSRLGNLAGALGAIALAAKGPEKI